MASCQGFNNQKKVKDRNSGTRPIGIDGGLKIEKSSESFFNLLCFMLQHLLDLLLWASSVPLTGLALRGNSLVWLATPRGTGAVGWKYPR